MTSQTGGRTGRDHTTKVLVTAASRHGSTAEIAQVIADELARCGIDAKVLDPEQVESVDGYDGVILGSAVYAGHWLEPAKDLAIRLAWGLGARPVWLFSSGPVGDPSRKFVQAMNSEPAEAAGVLAATHAKDHRIFAGKLDPKDLSLPRLAVLRILRGFDGDFRPWDDVRRWARDIAGQLGAPAKAA